MTREEVLTSQQLEEIRAAVLALPPMPEDALQRVAVMWAAIDRKARVRAAEQAKDPQ